MNAVYRDRMAGRGLGEEHRILIAPDERRMRELGWILGADRSRVYIGQKVKAQRTEGEDTAVRRPGRGAQRKQRRREGRIQSEKRANLKEPRHIGKRFSIGVCEDGKDSHARARKTHMRRLRRLTGERIP